MNGTDDIDADGDGLCDFCDPDYAAVGLCVEDSALRCGDGFDNDGDQPILIAMDWAPVWRSTAMMARMTKLTERSIVSMRSVLPLRNAKTLTFS